MMRAIVIAESGGPEVLELRSVERPAPREREVLVRVRATALNRADLLQREGKYPAPRGFPADIPGIEFAGEVAALGEGASQWARGDRVFGITGGGAYAEYLCAHEGTLARIPDALDFTAAAAVPEAFITAHDALMQAEMRPADTVLVHAAGSGVGLAAIQLIRRFGGVPFGTARHESKIAAARACGLEAGEVMSASLAELEPAVAEWTGGRGVRIVLDLVGGAYTAASMAVLSPRGCLVLIGTLAGARTELPLSTVLRNRLMLRGTVLRSRSLEEKIVITQAFANHVVPLLQSGEVRPVIDATFPLASARDAHLRMASNDGAGKLVLIVGDGTGS